MNIIPTLFYYFLDTPEADLRTVELGAGAVFFPNPHVNFKGVEAPAAHHAVMLIDMIISQPLPDVPAHIVESIRAG